MPTNHSALSPELIAAIEAGAWVITPNQRAAHWLKLLYANYALAQGRKAWATPAIYSFNDFILLLWRIHGGATERVLSAEQSQLLWERVVAASSWSELLLSPQAAAGSAFRAWERLLAWEITREQLVESADTADSNEARALVDWWTRFDAQCRERSWLPIALLPHRLMELTKKTPLQYIVTTASQEILPIQRRLLKHLASQGVRCEQLNVRITAGLVTKVACESLELELKSAAAWAKQQMQSGATSIGIIVPDLDQRAARVRRLFADAFAQEARTFVVGGARREDRAQQESSFAIASYHRLADFPIVRAALDLLQLGVGRATSSLAGGILRSPFSRASVQEASARALADARLRSQLREHYDFGLLERITSAANCPVMSQALLDAQKLRHTSVARALPSVMAEQFIALWRIFGWPLERSVAEQIASEASTHALSEATQLGTTLNSDEQQTVARLQSCLAEFGALDELIGPLTFSAAVREFEQLARNISFEPRSTPTPITIIDARAIDGLHFDAAWVVGMDEVRWPPAASPDPFIPVALQSRVGMPNATAQLTREHAWRRFGDLQRLASTAVFSWACKDSDIELLPSAWLAEIAPLEDVPVAEDDYAKRIFVNKSPLEIVEEGSAPPHFDSRARGGTRIFELQSVCPFRAFAELRLAARPLEEVMPSIDARARGTLIHAALADVWQTLGGSAGLHALDNAQLAVLVRTTLAKHASKLLDGASLHRMRMLQIEQDLAGERILALLEVDRGRQAFRVVGRPETKEQAIVGALQFELRLDRMDELLSETQRGERIIVDYKTGSTVSTQSWTRERPEQPQLPLYAVTHPQSLVAVAFATVGAMGVSYQGVARDNGLLPGLKAFNDKYLPAPYVQWNGLLAYWNTVITRLADEYSTGVAVVDPLPTACRYCHLSTLCRVHEVKEASILQESSLEEEEST